MDNDIIIENIKIRDKDGITFDMPEYDDFLKAILKVLQDTIPNRVDNTYIGIIISPGIQCGRSPDVKPDFSANVYFTLNEYNNYVPRSETIGTTIHEYYEKLLLYKEDECYLNQVLFNTFTAVVMQIIKFSKGGDLSELKMDISNIP